MDNNKDDSLTLGTYVKAAAISFVLGASPLPELPSSQHAIENTRPPIEREMEDSVERVDYAREQLADASEKKEKAQSLAEADHAIRTTPAELAPENNASDKLNQHMANSSTTTADPKLATDALQAHINQGQTQAPQINPAAPTIHYDR